MLFLVDKTTHEIKGQHSEFITHDDELEFLNDNPTIYLLPADNGIPPSHYPMYHLVDGAFELKPGMELNDPLIGAPEINRFRDSLHQLPLSYDGDTFDADDVSLSKMREIAEVIRDNDTLDWTLSDNTTKRFTGTQFKEVYRQIQYLRATRLYNHHAYAKNLKSKLPEVKRSALDLIEWGDGLTE